MKVFNNRLSALSSLIWGTPTSSLLGRVTRLATSVLVLGAIGHFFIRPLANRLWECLTKKDPSTPDPSSASSPASTASALTPEQTDRVAPPVLAAADPAITKKPSAFPEIPPTKETEDGPISDIDFKDRFNELLKLSEDDPRLQPGQRLGLISDEGKFTLHPRNLAGDWRDALFTGPAFHPEILKKDQESATVYFFTDFLEKNEIPKMLTQTFAMTTDGDSKVLRANTNRASGVQTTEYDKGLLSDLDRRRKTAGLMEAGYVTFTAKGGYGSPRTPLDGSYRVFFINTRGPQFEKYGKQDQELEAKDFIIKQGALENQNPMFSSYYTYTGGIIQAHSKIQRFSILNDKNWGPDYVQLKDGSFFNRAAFKKATLLTFQERVMPIINNVFKDKPFYLKATLFGGGIFAKVGMREEGGNLRKEVINSMVSAYVDLIQNNLIPIGSVIEFPQYGEITDLEPELQIALRSAQINCGISIVWSEHGDLCNFNDQQPLSGNQVSPSSFEKEGRLIILNAGDAMSFVGNEPASESVESMLANNSNLRFVFNWWANPLLLDPKKHVGLNT